MFHRLLRLCVAAALITVAHAADNSRPFKNDADAGFWLENMVVYHHFNSDEISAASGLPGDKIASELQRLNSRSWKAEFPNDQLKVLPYPGGRHPRIGFLEGAVDPQRETKISVFLPWDSSSYVVADVPEAIWSNLGLTYLAHTHVPTIWTTQKIELPHLEWERLKTDDLKYERALPNGIVFGAEVHPTKEGVRMREWLLNGTDQKLSDLRVQNCVMMKGAKGFTAQTNENKVFAAPYCAVKSTDGKHWVITGWAPIHRAWGNAPCPCLHADPKFPDCDPGQTVEVKGWISFFEGDDIQGEFRRLDGLNWK